MPKNSISWRSIVGAAYKLDRVLGATANENSTAEVQFNCGATASVTDDKVAPKIGTVPVTLASNLRANTVYSYRLTVTDAAGRKYIAFLTNILTFPDAPTLSLSLPIEGAVKASVLGTADNASGTNKGDITYTVEYSTESDMSGAIATPGMVGNGATTHDRNVTLLGNKRYYFRAKASNGAGSSPYTATQGITTRPTAPRITTAAIDAPQWVGSNVGLKITARAAAADFFSSYAVIEATASRTGWTSPSVASAAYSSDSPQVIDLGNVAEDHDYTISAKARFESGDTTKSTSTDLQVPVGHWIHGPIRQVRYNGSILAVDDFGSGDSSSQVPGMRIRHYGTVNADGTGGTATTQFFLCTDTVTGFQSSGYRNDWKLVGGQHLVEKTWDYPARTWKTTGLTSPRNVSGAWHLKDADWTAAGTRIQQDALAWNFGNDFVYHGGTDGPDVFTALGWTANGGAYLSESDNTLYLYGDWVFYGERFVTDFPTASYPMCGLDETAILIRYVDSTGWDGDDFNVLVAGKNVPAITS